MLKTSGLMFSVFLGGLLILLVGWVIASYNGFIRLRNRIEEAFATMDVYLKQRYDLIPNLLETVKGYARHEATTFENVTRARNQAAAATTPAARAEGEALLSGALKNLFALAESYPELSASANFLELQNQLKAVEVDIANARKYYNAVVNEYNTRIETFPNSLLAETFRFSRQALFQVGQPEERDRVNVKF